MAFDREAAKAAGYTDEEINAYLQAKRQEARKPTPAVDTTEPPPPTTQITPVETSAATVATTGALGVAPYAVPAVAGAAAAIGGSKLYGAWKQSADAAKALADAKMASEQGIAQRAAERAAQRVGPVAPSMPQGLVDQYGRPMAAPTAPTAPVAPSGMPATAPTTAAQPNMIQRGAEYVRQLAMNRLLPAAGQMIRSGGIAAAAMYSPELGPPVPKTGRMRGMEINPLTRQPWTRDQLAAYERNPQMFDSQLPPAQMPR